MAWALDFGVGGATYAGLQSPVIVGVGEFLEYKGIYHPPVSNNFTNRFVYMEVSYGDYVYLINAYGTVYRLRHDGTIYNFDPKILAEGEEFTFRYERTATEHIFICNGVEELRIQSTKDFAPLSGFGSTESNKSTGCKLIYCKIGSVLNIDATASDHSAGGQPVLTDTVGGNNATGVNFPTDGSAWVDLGGGAVTYDFELLSNSASSQFNNLSLAYNRLLNINTLSSTAQFNVLDFNYAQSYSFELNALTSNAQFNSLTLNYNRALKLNTLSSTAQFSNLTLEYVQLGTTYNFELNPLNASAEFDDLNLSYNRLFSLNTLSSSAVFSDLDFSQGLLFALNSLSSTAQFNQVQLTHNRVLNINSLNSSASFKSINIDYSGFIEQRIDNYSIAYASDLITVNYQTDLISVSYKD